MILSPEPSSAEVIGQMTAWKLSGKSRDDVTLKKAAGILVTTRLREQTVKAYKKYHDEWTAHEAKLEKNATESKAKATTPESKKPEAKKDSPEKPDSKKPDENEKEESKPKEPPKAPKLVDDFEPFRAVFEKKVPLVIDSSSASSLLSLAKKLKDAYGVRVIVRGPQRLDEVASSLRAGDIGALITVPFVEHRSAPQGVLNVPASLSRQDVRFAFRSSAAGGAAGLVPQVAYAVMNGLPRDDAIAAFTWRAAELFGIDDRVGTLEEGKDADLVFHSGDPLDLGSRVVGAIVEGEVRFIEDVAGEKP